MKQPQLVDYNELFLEAIRVADLWREFAHEQYGLVHNEYIDGVRVYRDGDYTSIEFGILQHQDIISLSKHSSGSDISIEFRFSHAENLSKVIGLAKSSYKKAVKEHKGLTKLEKENSRQRRVRLLQDELARLEGQS